MRLAPDVFWRYTLREWNDALEGFQRSKGIMPDAGLTSKELDELMEQYPDG